MKNPHTLSINLHRKEKKEYQKFIIQWAINIGRIVIVGTELILLGALIYRFIMDRQIINQHDEIRRKMSFLESFKAEEQIFRDLNLRLTNAGKIMQASELKMLTYNYLTDITSTSNYTIRRLSFTGTEIAIEGDADTIYSLSDLINDIRQQPQITSISVGQLTNVDNKLSFTLSASVK